ncbi:BatA domain-containing protein [Prolixibacter bellariivorans]|uniref:BatA domain-containing protein n=1 Tax=Prolixibacter bellariivorans TaxID=314319 RepID=UPI0011DC7518
MTFLYPTYFWALFLILIPIIIHIFKFRRYTTVYFSNVRALSQLKREEAAKTPERIVNSGKSYSGHRVPGYGFRPSVYSAEECIRHSQFR